MQPSIGCRGIELTPHRAAAQWCVHIDLSSICTWIDGTGGLPDPSGWVSLVVAITQFSFAFGPTLLGQLEQAEGSYSAGLLACLFMEVLAAFIVISPAIIRYRQARFKSEA